LLVPCLLLVGGCGKPAGDLNGKVTLNGEDLKAGQVMVFNDKQELIGQATIADGAYIVPNLPLGPITLTVVTHLPGGALAGPGTPPPTPEGARPLPKEMVKDMQKDLPESLRKAMEDLKPVPLKYTNPKESGLTTTIGKGDNNYNIVMTGKGEIPKAPPAPGPGGQIPPPHLLKK